MSYRTKAYVIWQGRISTEKIPTCEARLINMLRKENPVVCEILDKDALGELAWRPSSSYILTAVMEVALVDMREALDAQDVVDLPPVVNPFKDGVPLNLQDYK